jgi:Transposase DDE domain
MHKFTNTLTPAQVYRFAIDFCQPHLRFRAVGKVTGEVILSVLFAAAARLSSIHETCGRLAKAPCEETFTAALYPQLLDLDLIQRRVNAAFAAHLPRALRRRQRPLTIAADLTLIASYGRHELDDPQVYRSQAKRGTNSFFAYATVSLVLHGERFTLAVAPVTRSESLKQVLQELLLLVTRKGRLKIGLVLLDRGFYSVEVIRYLQEARRPFLMPLVGHGRKADHPLGPSGSNVFKAMKTSGWSTHTLQDGKKNKATVSVCVKRARYKNKHGKRKSETWVYAYWGIAPKRVDWVRDTYRRRFGIETSYRQMNQCRIRTTTRKFEVRFLYVAIGLLLRNLWVWLHHAVLSSPRRGCRRYNWELLRVERMLVWLEEVARSMYGLVVTVRTERHIPESVPS